jgi:phage shock protein PspC (stress-responsive transcriptional regulator)
MNHTISNRLARLRDAFSPITAASLLADVPSHAPWRRPRAKPNRVTAGVCYAVASGLNLRVTPIRWLAVICIFLFPLPTFPIYLALWAILPLEKPSSLDLPPSRDQVLETTIVPSRSSPR